MTLVRRDADGARIVEDPWRTLADDEAFPVDGDAIVSLERWQRERDGLRARAGRVGLRVSGDADPDALAAELEGVSLVAIELPKFTDGRAYSLARLLRRAGFRGELRAAGDVLRDQLAYLSRCGFESFELAPGKDAEAALSAFSDFSVAYQPAEDDEPPIWRRRVQP